MCMQETQPIHQTTTRTTQNKNIETKWIFKLIETQTEEIQKHKTNNYILREGWEDRLGTVIGKIYWGLDINVMYSDDKR